MKIKTFEDFLKEKHAEQYIGLDDEMPDDYDEWFYNKISKDDVVEFTDEYVNQQKQEMVDSVIPEKLEHDANCSAFDEDELGLCSCGRKWWNSCRQQMIDDMQNLTK